MKFIADINVTQAVIRNLRFNDHDVIDIKKQNPTIHDVDLVTLAQKEKRIILTHDKDFESLAEISKYQVGIIAVRLRIQNSQHHWLKLKELLENYSEDVLDKSLTIITEEGIDSTPYNQ